MKAPFARSVPRRVGDLRPALHLGLGRVVMPLLVLLTAALLPVQGRAQTVEIPTEIHEGARQLASYFVGQGVGLMNDSLSARTVVYAFMEDFLRASERLSAFTDE